MNVLNKNHVSRIRLTVFSLFMAVVLFACSITAQIPPTTPSPVPVIPDTGGGPSTTVVPIPVASYQDPDGLFSVVLPKNWNATQDQGYGLLIDPDNSIKVYVLSVPGDDAEQGVKTAWAVVDPSFALKSAQVEKPPVEGVEQEAKITYQTDDPQRSVSAIGRLVQGRIYAILTDGAADAVARRDSQLTIIETGYDIEAVKKLDLTGVAPKPFDAQLQAELEAYIAEAMPLADIPGTAVAVVQNGQIVYEKGFGVRELGKPDPVTPETRMMTGSTGKTLTTMMMATVVDDGKMTWDTPAQQIYPDFAVADPQLSKQITMRNLVCACTGVPRRDADLFFNSSHLTAKDIVDSLKTFTFFTAFGEAFQYSNQMVATGGYLAARAATGGDGDLYNDYVTQMKQRVFDPIGMANTGFSFDDVQASGNYAMPHGLNLNGEYVPLPLSVEEPVIPVAPAGAHWTTLHDMARFLLTQINHGVSPDGTRVVSAANLEETWKPQVMITAQSSYGLGWVVDQYGGLRLIHHDGATLGFSAEIAFLPEAKLGIVVMTNARYASNFDLAVRFRLLELVFGQPVTHDAQFKYQPKQFTAVSVPPLVDLDPAEVEPFLGTFHNDALGDITFRLQDGKLLLDAGEFVSELRAMGGGHYIMFDSVLVGLPIDLRLDEGGQPTAILLFPPNYTFTKSE